MEAIWSTMMVAHLSALASVCTCRLKCECMYDTICNNDNYKQVRPLVVRCTCTEPHHKGGGPQYLLLSYMPVEEALIPFRDAVRHVHCSCIKLGRTQHRADTMRMPLNSSL